MSGHSTYQPQSPFMQWMERRLPIVSLVYSSFIAYPTPRNLNYWWTFGGILSFMLVVQIVTGIVLAMHYTPHVDFAFISVESIMRDVNYGWLLRYLHANGASFFFVAVYAHIARGMYYGSYKEPREVLWILGVILFLLMVATGFMGYVLPWGQMSFWAATVITNLFSALPGVGEPIVTWLWGGYAVGNPTLNRFYSLHYLLPFVIAGVVVLHVWALHMVGQNNPTGVEPKTEKDSVAFTPYATVKDGFFIGVFCLFYAWFVFYLPNYLGHSDNYIMANPGQTPTHIVPEWYYLPFYAILRAIPSKLLGVTALASSIIILAFLPWLDTSRVRSANYRPLYRQFLLIFFAAVIGLGYLGSQEPSGGYVIAARILTVYYFGFFLVILPLLGLFETTKPLPNSISESVSEPRVPRHEIPSHHPRARFRGFACRPRPFQRRRPRTRRRGKSGRSPVRSASTTRRSCSAASRSTRKSARPATASSCWRSAIWPNRAVPASPRRRRRRSRPSSRSPTAPTTRARCSSGPARSPIISRRRSPTIRPPAPRSAASCRPTSRSSPRRAPTNGVSRNSSSTPSSTTRRTAPTTSTPSLTAIPTRRPASRCRRARQYNKYFPGGAIGMPKPLS